MLTIRKVKTASGAIAVQVILHEGHRYKIVKHIGSSKEEEKIHALVENAKDWINSKAGQTSLFPDRPKEFLHVDRGECIAVTHDFARRFLLCCLNELGLGKLDPLLLDLAMMRLIEPASKRRSIELLSRYFGINYSERIYRNIPKLISLKSQIESCAYKIATQQLNEEFYFVLYDVTTLYFESFHSDDLRLPGFSKDNKSQQPQIVIGLLVTQSGFPLSYEVFPGNTFEGKTMLPIVERFIKMHPEIKPIIVADAAMLSEERLTELRAKNISYIVGARLANLNLGLIKQINLSLADRNGLSSRFASAHGDLICDFSMKRYKKEHHELMKQIKKAQEIVAGQTLNKTAKFVKRITKEKVTLNESLIEKRKLLLGIKGYCTDIPLKKLPDEKVISYYHSLWRIEQSFRMSKTDLQTRPIFHYKEDAIRSHVLICFVALIIEKYLELKTLLSLREIRFLIWSITESHIQDNLTKKTFMFRSPTKEIMESNLRDLIKKWGLLPH